MKIIKADFDIIDPNNLMDPMNKVERVARVCYKSEDQIKAGSAEKMVRSLIKSNHTAMLEHSSLVVSFSEGEYHRLHRIVSWLEDIEAFDCFLRFTANGKYIVSGNIRAWREFLVFATGKGFTVSHSLVNILRSDKYGAFFDDIVFLPYEGTSSAVEVDPMELSYGASLIHTDITVKFTVDRGVSHEIVRHRVASFAQESTRYCNYGSKGGEITVIHPCYITKPIQYVAWENACKEAESSYLIMLRSGATPQEARSVLPTSLKTEIVMTANLKEWRHFFKLRACGVTGKPHPQMLEVAVPLLKEFKELIPVAFRDLEPLEV